MKRTMQSQNSGITELRYFDLEMKPENDITQV